MGQAASSPQEDTMKKRIRQTMGSFADLQDHLHNANDWARLCPTPKTCYLAFRIVINDRVSAELLPYVWRLRGNVYVEARKIRRSEDKSNFSGEYSGMSAQDITQAYELSNTIGQAKVLTVRQFYYIYCFLSDVRSCSLHTFQGPEHPTDVQSNAGFDEAECQICMDKRKQVVLPCTHSFCLSCFQHWSAQNKTCPICRSTIECSEGDELWHLTSNEVEDIGTYATDLVARIYEFLERRSVSRFNEQEIQMSADMFQAALATASKLASLPPPSMSLVPASHSPIFPTLLAAGDSMLSTSNQEDEEDEDAKMALEMAASEGDQYAAMRYYEQLRRDAVVATAMAMQYEHEDEFEGEDLE